MGSFIDYWLVTELSKNPDGYRGSVYFSKNVGSPIAFGPPWVSVSQQCLSVRLGQPQAKLRYERNDNATAP